MDGIMDTLYRSQNFTYKLRIDTKEYTHTHTHTHTQSMRSYLFINLSTPLEIYTANLILNTIFLKWKEYFQIRSVSELNLE
jgi:hypothetical protein